MRARFVNSPLTGNGILYSGDDFICRVEYEILVDDEAVCGQLTGDANSLSRIERRKPLFLECVGDKLRVELDHSAVGNRIKFRIIHDDSARICREAARG
jgi:hypothetical protein